MPYYRPAGDARRNPAQHMCLQAVRVYNVNVETSDALRKTPREGEHAHSDPDLASGAPAQTIFASFDDVCR
jgi:hypothetical protein